MFLYTSKEGIRQFELAIENFLNNKNNKMEIKEKEYQQFKIGDEVEIIANTNFSVNKIGEIGIIVSNPYPGQSAYRVQVGDRVSDTNWTKITEIRLVNKIDENFIAPTDREIFESIKVEYSNNNFKIAVLNRSGRLIIWTSPIRINTSNISCGIKQLYNLNELFQEGYTLKSFLNSYKLDSIFDEETQLELLKKGFKLLFDNYKIGLLIMSTNIDANKDFKKIANIIESNEHVIWTDTYNANSRNNIRLWSVNLHKIQNG